MRKLFIFSILCAMTICALLTVSCKEEQYSVTVTNNGNGTGIATPAAAEQGTLITLTATPDDGYYFEKWTVVGGSVVLDSETATPATFTMPAGDVEIRAEFAEDTNGFDIITDPVFKEYCQQFDTNKDGFLSRPEVEAVTEIDVSSRSRPYLDSKIESLAGIELFTKLTHLNCYDNNLSELDVSKNIALIELSCSSNENLTVLDVSKNIALEILFCSGNLNTLDVSGAVALRELNCSGNKLSVLDVSNNIALEILDCSNNSDLTTLELRGAIALKKLDCSSNRKLSVLDVSTNLKLEVLNCSQGMGSYEMLSVLDLSNNPELDMLNCSYNNLTSLDISKNTKLRFLSCYDNSLTSLDTSKNTELLRLYCFYNNISALDVRNNLALNDFQCSDNNLSADAIRALFLSLPMCLASNTGNVSCDRNPGSKEITAEDLKVAEDKNWRVNI